MIRFYNFHFVVLACLLCLIGCTSFSEMREESEQKRALEKLAAENSAKYEEFLKTANLRNDTYRNDAVLARAGDNNQRIEVGLKRQRGIFFVDDMVAIDFPIARGLKAFPTPKCEYTILSKKEKYASNLYGTIYDAAGTAIVKDADARVDAVPEGGKYVGAKMPYWMRLTNSGIGFHIGYVPGGRGASHGCIRLRPQTAKTLFHTTYIGTPVTISDKEPFFALSE
ncbi:MAG: L,D-transpeptidase [Chthoniobacterales bacterium]